MWTRLYYIDLTTILTLMAIGALLGFMLGRRLMDIKMLIVFTIVFLVATFIFLDSIQPDIEEKQIRAELPKAEAPKEFAPENTPAADGLIIEPSTE